MNLISEDIQSLLCDSSVGIGVLGQDVFIEFDPETPDNRIVIYSTGGFDPDPNEIFNPTFTVHIFNKVLLTGYSKAIVVRQALHNLSNRIINGTNYLHILLSGDLNSLGKEGMSFKFSLNFTVKRESI